ncbi:MAG: ribose-phosphate pyrophosphokinase-like domain-containing protein [Micropruina glycogenica]
MTDDITVFSGSAHREFATEVCDLLGIELAPSQTTRFSNDCLQVHLDGNTWQACSSCSRWCRYRRTWSSCTDAGRGPGRVRRPPDRRDAARHA